MTDGVLIISIGPRQTLLNDCVSSLRRHCPHIPVHVVSDSRTGLRGVLVSSEYQGMRSRHYKTWMHKLTPYDGVTLFLDDDTVINKPLPSLESLLGAGDVALGGEPPYPHVRAICSKSSRRRQYRREQRHTLGVCNPEQPYYNSGVFLFRRTPAAVAMLDCWHEEWQRFQSVDQLALCRAMHYYPVHVTQLDSAEYNCHNDYFDYKALDPAIYHFSRKGSRRWYHRHALSYVA